MVRFAVVVVILPKKVRLCPVSDGDWGKSSLSFYVEIGLPGLATIRRFNNQVPM